MCDKGEASNPFGCLTTNIVNIFKKPYPSDLKLFSGCHHQCSHSRTLHFHATPGSLFVWACGGKLPGPAFGTDSPGWIRSPALAFHPHRETPRPLPITLGVGDQLRSTKQQGKVSETHAPRIQKVCVCVCVWFIFGIRKWILFTVPKNLILIANNIRHDIKLVKIVQISL